jgi:hypothetical protein
MDHVDVHNVDGALGPDFDTIEQQHITEWDDLPRKVHSRTVGKSRALEGADRSLVKLCADRSLRPSRKRSVTGRRSGYGTTKVALTPLSRAPLNVRLTCIANDDDVTQAAGATLGPSATL